MASLTELDRVEGEIFGERPSSQLLKKMVEGWYQKANGIIPGAHRADHLVHYRIKKQTLGELGELIGNRAPVRDAEVIGIENLQVIIPFSRVPLLSVRTSLSNQTYEDIIGTAALLPPDYNYPARFVFGLFVIESSTNHAGVMILQRGEQFEALTARARRRDFLLSLLFPDKSVTSRPSVVPSTRREIEIVQQVLLRVN